MSFTETDLETLQEQIGFVNDVCNYQAMNKWALVTVKDSSKPDAVYGIASANKGKIRSGSLSELIAFANAWHRAYRAGKEGK